MAQPVPQQQSISEFERGLSFPRLGSFPEIDDNAIWNSIGDMQTSTQAKPAESEAAQILREMSRELSGLWPLPRTLSNMRTRKRGRGRSDDGAQSYESSSGQMSEGEGTDQDSQHSSDYDEEGPAQAPPAPSGRPVITTAYQNFPPGSENLPISKSLPVTSPFAHPEVQNPTSSMSEETRERQVGGAPAGGEAQGEVITLRTSPRREPRTLRSSGNARGGRRQKEPSKIGRPITYKGDLSSPNLTEAERRRIKRRIANRESARRVRQKRQEELDEMKGKIDVLVAHNRRLAEYVADVDTHKRQMFAQMGDLRRRWSQTISDNVRLQAELAALKQAKEQAANGFEPEAVPSVAAALPSAAETTPAAPEAEVKQEGPGPVVLSGMGVLPAAAVATGNTPERMSTLPSQQLDISSLSMPMNFTTHMSRDLSLATLPSMCREESLFRGLSGLLTDMLPATKGAQMNLMGSVDWTAPEAFGNVMGNH